MINARRSTITSQCSDVRNIKHTKEFRVPVTKTPGSEPIQFESAKEHCQECLVSPPEKRLFASQAMIENGHDAIVVPPAQIPTRKVIRPQGTVMADAEASEDDLANAYSLRGRFGVHSSLRLLLLNNAGTPLPESISGLMPKIDPNVQIRNSWDSVINALRANSCAAPDVIIALSAGYASVARQIEELYRLRVLYNYSPRPVYFWISQNTQSALVKYDIERLGAHFMHCFDVPTHFQSELEQIRLELAPTIRSMPSWLVVQEGNGATMRADVYLRMPRKLVRIQGADRPVAALAAFIKHNGIVRSLSAWQKVLADDPLFEPGGGGFDLPSLASIKMYLHRDFPRYLQATFDEYRSGFCASRVIEQIDPGTHRAKYRIRGEWEVIRR